MRVSVIWRTTRFRVAVAAAVSSLIALGAVGTWFVVQAQDRLETTAGQIAEQQLVQMHQAMQSDIPLADLSKRLLGIIFEVTDRQGNRLANCPTLKPGHPLRPPGPIKEYTDFVITFDQNGLDRNSRADYSCLHGFGQLDDSGKVSLHLFARFAVGKPYILYTAAAVDPYGQAAVDTARMGLLIGVPLVALLIGAIAWLAVRRSLRPVEAIRSEVAAISAHDLGRRVPVPGSADELSRLAETMNTMLTRLDTAVTRQGRFTADASHELRTPLASMRNQVEVLLTYPDEIDWRRSSENVLLDIARMEDLVTDLLLLSKLDGANTAPLVPVSLAEIVDACLNGRVPRGGVVITSAVDGEPVVAGNRTRLTRLLRNLVDNAERHAAHRVRVTVSSSDTECVLTVADDGPGIPDEDRERVFDRFVRLDDGRDRDDGGSGLGLAIVAEIAHAHGGTVTADGAVLTVRLPSAASP
ncbi:sensor histidine kinase [Amycolatopsis sp. NPDC059657]|uniref:sensor histidine kinase n=1 Tax=Amycolatopsis sp. NPDC059657 TaxID=3346899 RepID=UPI00366DA814